MISRECPHCGDVLPTDGSYCGACGTPADSRLLASEQAPQRRGWRLVRRAPAPLAPPAPPHWAATQVDSTLVLPLEAEPGPQRPAGAGRVPLALALAAVVLLAAGAGLMLALPEPEPQAVAKPVPAQPLVFGADAASAPVQPAAVAVGVAQPELPASAAAPAPAPVSPEATASQAALMATAPPAPALPAVRSVATLQPAAPAVPVGGAAAVGLAGPDEALAQATAWFEAGEQAADAAAVRAFYAERVRYYERGELAWDAVAADKTAYLQRWPVRRYQLQKAQVLGEPSAEGAVQVALLFNWQVERAGGQWRRGVATTVLTLQRLDGRWRIVSEKAG